MGIEVRWDNKAKTIILMTLGGHWGWQDLQEAVFVCNQMIESVPHHVHFILDRQGGHWTPGNLLSNVGKIISTFTPNDGYRVIVTENPLIKQLFYLFTMLNGGADLSIAIAADVKTQASAGLKC